MFIPSAAPIAVKPFSEVLAQAVPVSQPCQGGDHRVLTGAVREDGPIHPQGQTPLLGWSEVWKMLGNSLVRLIPFARKAHESPPRIPVAVSSRMKGKLSTFLVFFGRVSAFTYPCQPLARGEDVISICRWCPAGHDNSE